MTCRSAVDSRALAAHRTGAPPNEPLMPLPLQPDRVVRRVTIVAAMRFLGDTRAYVIAM